jgi:hypothetical protein
MFRTALIIISSQLVAMLTVLPPVHARQARFDRALSDEMRFYVASTGGNCLGCTWIAAEGTISEKSADHLREFLQKNEYVRGMIHLNSPGGSLRGGLKLGELIRQEKLDTLVSKTVGTIDVATERVESSWEEKPASICASACAFAFMGGVRRHAISNYYKRNLIWTRGEGKIGVHQFYHEARASDDEMGVKPPDVSSVQYIVGQLIEYAVRMGISADLVKLSSSVPPGEMHWLADDELINLRTDNGEKAYKQEIVALQGGAAATVITFEAQLGAYTIVLFCDPSGNPRFSAKIKRDHIINAKELEDWKLYEGMLLKRNGQWVPVKLTSRTVSLAPAGGSVTELSFEVPAPWTTLSEFNFEDNGSRYSTYFASDLSFAISNANNTMRLLARTCR